MSNWLDDSRSSHAGQNTQHMREAVIRPSGDFSSWDQRASNVPCESLVKSHCLEWRCIPRNEADAYTAVVSSGSRQWDGRTTHPAAEDYTTMGTPIRLYHQGGDRYSLNPSRRYSDDCGGRDHCREVHLDVLDVLNDYHDIILTEGMSPNDNFEQPRTGELTDERDERLWYIQGTIDHLSCCSDEVISMTLTPVYFQDTQSVRTSEK